MRPEEAQWINAALHKHILTSEATPSFTVLNLGCGTKESREIKKPYIYDLTIQPLSAKGFNVIHSDLIKDPGVDISGNLFDPEFSKKLQILCPSLIYFCNIFEHLPKDKITEIPLILDKILQPNGYIMITAPRSYPYHPDPIDSMYRPDINSLTNLFKNYTVISADEIECGSYRQDLASTRKIRIIRKIIRLFFPFIHPKRWASHAHRFFWLFKPYKITCVLLKKTA